MIFATLGNAPLPFIRFAAELDRIAPELGDEIVIQQGHTPFQFTNARACPFMDGQIMKTTLQNADIVVTHGGWGTISECITMGKRIVVVPRQQGSEHNHDQFELVRALEAKNLVIGVYEIENLKQAIGRSRTFDYEPLKRGNAGDLINQFLHQSFPQTV